MPVTRPKVDLSAERGFSMFLVVVAMLVTSMFVAAAFVAVNGDYRLSAESKNRKISYAAAEAGLGWYVKQLRSNPDYWAKCDTAEDPNGSERNPISQQYDGPGTTDSRVWRKLPDKKSEYSIELLHTPKYDKCYSDKQDSLIDMSSGTFKVRINGRSTDKLSPTRSIVATFQRKGFLRFVYFTDQENRDPQAELREDDRDDQQANCVDKNRTARKGKGCVEIQFATNDAINGPLHTNDESLLVCGTPIFGRETLKNGAAGKTDTIEVTGDTPGYVDNGCTATPTIWTPNRKFTLKSDNLDLPENNQDLVTVADSDGRSYSGKTIVRLKGTTMDVRNYTAENTYTTSYDVPWPNNGVLYVKNRGACKGEIPTEADYDEPVACGNVYVSGNYSKPLTIAAANDVIIRPTKDATLTGKSDDSDILLNDGTDAVLGLIGNNFVRVGHRINRSSCTNYSSTNEPLVTDVRIDAAIMSLQHSFIVDNYNCGRAGTLTVNGAIVQRYRGPVGTGNAGSIATGFLKNYWYDDRLRFRNPPYFLNPLKSKWEISRQQEQVGSPRS
jgi:hypothetical protein